jgi:hypothetical protein
MEEQKFKFPTEMVDLPSKGLVYPEGHPLSSGQVEMKYMTAREEDILTNQNYISKGVVIDKLLQSLIVTKFDYNTLLIGDKNALLVASRILGYGKDYDFNYLGEVKVVDLSKLDNKILDDSIFIKGKNEFTFTLPHSNTPITFKLLTEGDENKIEDELKGLKKINKDSIPELTTRLKQVILSIDGDYEKKTIREFVDNYLLAKDSRALREYIGKIQPDVDLTFEIETPDEETEKINIPIGLNFFFPDA